MHCAAETLKISPQLHSQSPNLALLSSLATAATAEHESKPTPVIKARETIQLGAVESGLGERAS